MSEDRRVEFVLPSRFAEDGRFDGDGTLLRDVDDRVIGEVTEIRPEDDGLHIKAVLHARKEDSVHAILGGRAGLHYGVSVELFLPGREDDRVD